MSFTKFTTVRPMTNAWNVWVNAGLLTRLGAQEVLVTENLTSDVTGRGRIVQERVYFWFGNWINLSQIMRDKGIEGI